ncbi:MAG: hypothetical protein ACE5MM_00205 [Nitrospiraceae bacterium]
MKTSFIKATDSRRLSPGEKPVQRPGMAKPLVRYHLVLAIVLALPAFLSMPLVDPGNALGQEEIGQVPNSGQWEGSLEGTAFSLFNHRLGGFAVILVGLSELRTGLGLIAPAWSRFLLPFSLLGFGAYLTIWSDHAAWPIGPLSLTETLFGGDPEILQHKIYAVFLIAIGFIELLRRTGRIQQAIWSTLLPAFAIFGGWLLLIHMHGPHPAAHKIAMHHSIIGALAISAGSCWFASRYSRPARPPGKMAGRQSKGMIAWATLIVLIVAQLLL